ncbi:Segregation/condensation protein B [[Mycoplasma] cavipharyngis]|uniref:SMC-Scp complex subunit ScpB n=1 Tax=[Mycoplasma] cavipharyngis TaxID=92757 RepID=UPI0037044F85
MNKKKSKKNQFDPNNGEISLEELIRKKFETTDLEIIDHIKPLNDRLDAITNDSAMNQANDNCDQATIDQTDHQNNLSAEAELNNQVSNSIVFSLEETNLHQKIVEAALFTVGSSGLKISDLKRILNNQSINSDYLHDLIKTMRQNYLTNPTSGITIEKFDDVYKMTTKSDLHYNLSKLIKTKLHSALTNSLMEVLAIIAYNEPCSKSLIFKVRNIDPSSSIDKLIKLGLIYQYKRSDTPGKPWLYKLTNNFFDVFGIKSRNQLPKINNNLIQTLDQDLIENSEIETNEKFFDINRKTNFNINNN